MDIDRLMDRIEGATNFGMGVMKGGILAALEALQDELVSASTHEEYLRGEIDKLEVEVDILRDFQSDVQAALRESELRELA